MQLQRHSFQCDDNKNLKAINIDFSSWTESLFQRMFFLVKNACTCTPDVARKEAELLFDHSIVNKVGKYQIPPSLIININQTPMEYAPVSSQAMAVKKYHRV